MDEAQFLGYLLTAIITLGGFVAVIMKFIQPINDLRVVIQKLNDIIDTLKNDNTEQNKKIEEHTKDIGDLKGRVNKVEIKMDMYHKNEGRS